MDTTLNHIHKFPFPPSAYITLNIPTHHKPPSFPHILPFIYYTIYSAARLYNIHEYIYMEIKRKKKYPFVCIVRCVFGVCISMYVDMYAQMSPRLNPNFSYIDFGVRYMQNCYKRNHVPHVRESIEKNQYKWNIIYILWKIASFCCSFTHSPPVGVIKQDGRTVCHVIGYKSKVLVVRVKSRFYSTENVE